MNSRTFGIGILGTGIMGRRMLAALQPHVRFRVVAAWDPDATALKSALAQVTGVRAAASADDLIGDPEVDVVYVASPPALHAGAARSVLAADTACFCEKPLTHDTAEAVTLRDAVLRSGLPFAVNFPFRKGAASCRKLELVRDGSLGKALGATVRLRLRAGRVTGRLAPALGSRARRKADSRARCCPTSSSRRFACTGRRLSPTRHCTGRIGRRVHRDDVADVMRAATRRSRMRMEGVDRVVGMGDRADGAVFDEFACAPSPEPPRLLSEYVGRGRNQDTAVQLTYALRLAS